MAAIKLRFFVDELSNVLLQYDQIKVYRSIVDQTGPYVEITGPGTRIDLISTETLYEYIDAVGDPNYWYRFSYYNSATFAEGSMSSPIQGSDPGLYVNIIDIRNEGIDEFELSDARAISLSAGWQQWFNHRTGQFFIPRELDFKIDGDGSRVLWLPFPVIELTALYINESTTALDPTSYTVYNRYFPQDDRKNPRIKLKGQTSSIYGYSGNLFSVGDQNQRLVGTFGYVEEDGSTPHLVKREILTLINATKENMGDGEIDVLKSGRIIEEVTDRHRVRYADLWDKLKSWQPTGLTEVDEALRIYRRPVHVGAPRSFASVSL